MAVDSSPAFATGERLGLYFVDLLQDFEFSVSPPRTQSKQIGSQNFGADSINFSPDVLANISYLSKREFGTDSMFGALFRPSGIDFPVFSGARAFSSNVYLFTSDLQSHDLIKQIQNTRSFSGVTAIALGNCYLNELNLSFSAGNLAKNSCSIIASNIISEALSGNYMQIPAINLESGTTGGAGTIFLNPLQVDRLPTGNLTGELINTWSARFQPSFENLQLPHNQLSNFTEAKISSLDVSLSIDRENSYGFGSDHVYGRDIKYPIQGSISIAGLVSDYRTGGFAEMMQNERKYNIQIYDRDYQDEYLSGLSLAEFTGINESGHIVNNHWLKFNGCVLREKRDSLSVNGLYGFSTQFDFAANEFGGMTFKHGEEYSLDQFSSVTSDWHELVSSDGQNIFGDYFLRYYEADCSVATLLSSDKLILLTADNFCYDSEIQNCVIPPSYYWSGVCGYIDDGSSTTGAYSLSGGGSNFNNNGEQINYPVVAYFTGTLGNGTVLKTGLFYNQAFRSSSGVMANTAGSGFYYRLDRHRFTYSGGVVQNFSANYFPARGTFSSPQITGLSWKKYSSPSVSDRIDIVASTGGSEVIEVNWKTGTDGWFTSNGGSSSFSNMLRFRPAADVVAGTRQTGIAHLKAFFIGTGTSPWGANCFEYYPVGYRGTGMMSGNVTGITRDCASGLAFDEGSITFNEEGTLRWSSFNSGYGIPTGWGIYRFMSGVSSPSKIGSSSSRVYTDSTMVDAGIYGFYVSSFLSGYESNTGTSSIIYIEAF